MNSAEQIYPNLRNLPEPLALEVLHFVEFLKLKHDFPDKLEQKIQLGIEQVENSLTTADNLGNGALAK